MPLVNIVNIRSNMHRFAWEQALTRKATALRFLSRLDEAEATFRLALAIDPVNPECRDGLRMIQRARSQVLVETMYIFRTWTGLWELWTLCVRYVYIYTYIIYDTHLFIVLFTVAATFFQYQQWRTATSHSLYGTYIDIYRPNPNTN